ncbi:hypothetical protein MRB53_011110 [Persea americana]|uniref:Uncharacterized protein n=1 Tax=Persea americana TaxID=3435 RepID=A0ACC2LUI9_PERAE|nr:hypothetical protein MRB53_011110 [Persea americana]
MSSGRAQALPSAKTTMGSLTARSVAANGLPNIPSMSGLHMSATPAGCSRPPALGENFGGESSTMMATGDTEARVVSTATAGGGEAGASPACWGASKASP